MSGPDAHPDGGPAAVTCLVVGPPEHGVVGVALEQHAQLARLTQLARLGAAGDVHLVRLPARPAVDELVGALAAAPPGPVLVHVTDKLFGRGPEPAADALVAAAAVQPLVTVLHDLPQPSDGAVNHPRRAAAYRRVADASAVVVVASRHEARLLAACGARAQAAVVPLPVPDLGPVGEVDRDAPLTAVAVLGYLYPGKGHDAVVAALDALPPGAGLLAWGRPSEGHDDLVAALQDQAAALGRTATVSGWVPDEELPALLRSAVVPVAPHAHLSASGSISAWIGAGRRPLVPRSDYVEELLERSPGCVEVYDDLRSALARAWAEPRTTWAEPGSRPRPTPAETVAQVLAVLEGV